MPAVPQGRPTVTSRRALLAAGGLMAGGLATTLAACSSSSGGSSTDGDRAAAVSSAPSTTDTSAVRIGYFPNLTHAPALIAEQQGFFTGRIGADKVTTQLFNAGPDVVNAIFGGSLDISYIGSNPTITAYATSSGSAVRVVAGSTSGGASLVVKKGITGAAGLKGKTLATPQLANTQDVALRYWLQEQGLATDTEGGGDVSITPQKNAAALQAFTLGQIDGAWVPEPYATQFVQAGAVVLVDERDLWDGGEFVTTDVIVRTAFLDEHPGTVRAFLEAHLDALDLIADDPSTARTVFTQALDKAAGTTTDPSLVEAAWENLTFTADPLAATLKESATHADAVGLLENAPTDDFASLWDLDLLNAALTARGEASVQA